MNVLDNSPSTGYISWTGVNISYKGKSYKIADANTNLAYVYWKFSDPLSFYGSNIFPTLGADDLLVFVNKSGTHLVVPNTTILDGSLFVPGSILANALAVNSVTSDKILAGAISAAKLAVGAVGADKIAAGAVIADKIAAGAVDVGKLSVKELSAISSDLGNIKAGDIQGVNISGSTLKVANAPIWGDGTTFVQMKNGEIFVTDKNPDIVSRANADDLHITDGAIWMVGYDANDIGKYELDLAPKYILLTELNKDGSISRQTNIRAEFFENPKITTNDLNVNGTSRLNGMVNVGGSLIVDGPIQMLNSYSNVDLNNNQLINVDRLTFADPGGNEGIEWLGGNGWKIFESPDDASNAKGALQFFTGSTRRFTVGTTGNIYLTGTRCIIQGTGGSFEAEGKLVLQNTTAGTILTLGSDAAASPNYVQSIDVYNRTYSPAANMYVTSSGVIGRTTSATKYKLEIDDSKVDPYKILDLNPKTWYDKAATEAYADALTREHAGEVVDWTELDIPQLERVSGLIAEDVIAAGLPEYATYEFNEDGTREVEGLMYDRLWTLLIPVVRDQKKEITLLKEQVKFQDEKISNLESRLAALEAKINI
ncbi:hypothetical protein ACQKFG_15180 [Peribacillus sp. NPDC076916]|uniref:hypothetical protein n=1 Tax=Peribacillus sp. NPDC076916 TaxID=3390608 RepID=UPI003D025C0C